jgi:hypothetical protein
VPKSEATAIGPVKSGPTELTRLLVPGVLGFYTHFEATEIVAFKDKGGSPPINVFSIFVAEDRDGSPPVAPHFLNKAYGRLQLPSLKGWTFGVMRYLISAADLLQHLARLVAAKEWAASGNPLSIGSLRAMAPQFVPPDGLAEVPWNNVLKNNFFCGSYVFEWEDQDKARLDVLFAEPRRLQELSAAVQPFAPIRIAALSDKIGNIAVQIPVTILRTAIRQHPGTGLQVGVAWHPRATPRPLRVSSDFTFDSALSGFGSEESVGDKATLRMPTERGEMRVFVWDDHDRVLLAATAPSVFVNTIAINAQIGDPEPRTFSVPDESGQLVAQRVDVVGTALESTIGSTPQGAASKWTNRRIYSADAQRSAAERRFIQYRPQPGREKESHEKALDDIRHLINLHGRHACWLWDPYLSANDILTTLFFCQFGDAELRALTAAQPLPGADGTKAGFVTDQRARLEAAKGNRHRLRLEYRARVGQEGWGFHDRFLIFPRPNQEALAWSLGASVNSVGKQHHILQKVDDGQLILDAFLELWEELDQPLHVVWKST